MKSVLVTVATAVVLGLTLAPRIEAQTARAPTAQAQAGGQEVRVTLTGVEARGGQILATLQTADQFMQQRGAYSAMQPAPAANGAVTLVFTNVAPGDYTLSVLHDANGDFQMQRQPDGRPLEGWAMSNEAHVPSHQRPTFADTHFTVAGLAVTLTEAMLYPAAH